VKPENGTRETEFIYRVWARAVPGESGILGLGIFDSSGKEIDSWEPPGNTVSENFEVFEFPQVVFGTDALLGDTTYKYYIVGTGTIVSYPGPKLIEEEFSDLCVDPKKGTNTTWFDFNTNLSSSEKGIIPVTLQVSSDKETWLNVANKSYDNINPGKPIPINFTMKTMKSIGEPKGFTPIPVIPQPGVISV
jgi:hypothetical protein